MGAVQLKNFKQLDYGAREAINTLCTNLSFAGGDIRKIIVTSYRPSEGKSFISMNLMRAFANIGCHVLLIDADLRGSVLRYEYAIEAQDTYLSGLTRYLAGKCAVESIIQTTNIANADIILSGRTVSNSLPLINSERMKALFDYTDGRYDIVIVDAPPVGTIIDAAKIAAYCDGTLYVVESGVETQQELRDGLQQMERAGSTVLGIVLNKYQNSSDKYYDYYSDHLSPKRKKTSKP